MKLLILFAAWIALIALPGCAHNPRQATAEDIAHAVQGSPSHDGMGYLWRAPELQIRHYRASFSGFDTTYYRLVASKARVTEEHPVYGLWIIADYGGKPRQYAYLKLPDGSNRPLKDQKHAVERCQEFSNMVSACLYKDSAAAEFTRSELEKARDSGLTLIPNSGTEDYETLDFPPHYLQGFLQAVK